MGFWARIFGREEAKKKESSAFYAKDDAPRAPLPTPPKAASAPPWLAETPRETPALAPEASGPRRGELAASLAHLVEVRTRERLRFLSVLAAREARSELLRVLELRARELGRRDRS